LKLREFAYLRFLSRADIDDTMPDELLRADIYFIAAHESIAAYAERADFQGQELLIDFSGAIFAILPGRRAVVDR